MTPLKRFVLMAALWLPLMFLLWFSFSSVVVFPITRLSAWIFSEWMPDLILHMEQNRHLVQFDYKAVFAGVSGLPSQGLVIEKQDVNVLEFTYGVAMLAGLIMATPLAWRHVFLQFGIGYIIIVGTATLGVIGNVLYICSFGVGNAVEQGIVEYAPQYAALAKQAGAAAHAHMLQTMQQYGLNQNVIALFRQFTSLVLPSVTPVIVWLAMNKPFIETLVGWREDPEAQEASTGSEPNTDQAV